MKKVGLLTIHESTNYGAILQAYALQKSIESCGVDCEIINHDRFGGSKNARMDNKKKGNDFSWISEYSKVVLKNPRVLYMHLFKKEWKLKLNKNTKVKCDEFRNKYMAIGEQVYRSNEEIKSAPPIYDAYICGSDQIWNPNRFSYSEPFYLTFVPSDTPKISYAPSIALDEIPEGLKQSYFEYLDDFHAISVREQKGSAQLKKILGRDIETVLDPTLLISSEKWRKIAVEPNLKKPYIFCYFLSHSDLAKTRKTINKYASTIGAEVVVVLGRYVMIDSKWTTLENIGPAEFLGLIDNAELVFTNSFHGLVFSINFNKEFYVYGGKESLPFQSRFSRLENILNILDISNRIIYEGKSLYHENIDYKLINIKLSEEVNKSYRFLRDSLSSALKNGRA